MQLGITRSPAQLRRPAWLVFDAESHVKLDPSIFTERTNLWASVSHPVSRHTGCDASPGQAGGQHKVAVGRDRSSIEFGSQRQGFLPNSLATVIGEQFLLTL